MYRTVEVGEGDQRELLEAAGLIAKTTALRDRVRSSLAAYVDTQERLSLDGTYRLMLAKFDAMPDPAAARREQGELLLEVVALRVLLAREFEPRDSKSHQPDEAAAVTP